MIAGLSPAAWLLMIAAVVPALALVLAFYAAHQPGASDAGASDAGASDAGASDAGASDAGAPGADRRADR